MLTSAFTLYFWAVLTSTATIGLLIWTSKAVDKSDLKNAFMACLIAYLTYSLPLLTVQLFSAQSALVRLVSQMIHGGGIVFVWMLGRFIIMLARPTELGSFRFKLFSINYALLFVASFAGLIEHGVAAGPHGLYPIPGPLMTYFNISMLVFTLYFLVVCGRSYLRSQDDLLLCQIRAIFWSALPAFAMLMLTNAIVPGITGNFEATPAGALWLLLCFAGVGHILVTGKDLLLDQELARLTRLHKKIGLRNPYPLRSFVGALARNASAAAPASIVSTKFESLDGSTIYCQTSRMPEAPTRSSQARQVGAWVDAIEQINALAPINGTLAATALPLARHRADAGPLGLQSKRRKDLGE